MQSNARDPGVWVLVLGLAATLALGPPARADEGDEPTEDDPAGDDPAGDADEDGEETPGGGDTTPPDADLLDRIEELERRLAELEAEEHAEEVQQDEQGSEEHAEPILEDEIAAALAEDLEREGHAGEEPASAPTMPRFLQSMNPQLAFIADVGFAWFSVDEPLMLGGHDPKYSGFFLQQLELSIGASVDPFFRVDGNIVFSQFGVEIEEVYATTLGIPGGFQFRVGQFLTRFGRINASHPHSWDFVDQSLVIGKFMGGEGNRGLGVEVSWLTPLPWYVEVVAAGIDGRGESTGRSFWGASDLGFRDPRDLEYVLALKQFWPLGADASLSWGFSWALGPNGTGLDNRTDLFGTDIFLKIRPIRAGRYFELRWQTEAMLRNRQVPGGLNRDWGGYTYVVVRFAKMWEAGIRYELVSGIEGDDLDPDWTSLRQRIAPQITFRPSHFSRVRLQVDVDNPTWHETPWQVGGMLAFEFVIGAHPAHKY